MSKSLKARRYEALELYWQSCLDVLQLHEWRGDIERDVPEEDDAEAAAFIRYEANFFRLRVSAEFWDMTPERQRETLAHELMHLPTFHWASDTLEVLKAELGSHAYTAIESVLQHGFERVTDRLGMMVAHLLPPPSLPR
jgi:hypothetical protein